MPRFACLLLFALILALPAQAHARCGPANAKRVAAKGAIQVTAERRGDDRLLHVCRGEARAILLSDNADRASVLLTTGRRAVIASGYDAARSDGAQLPASWSLAVVDFTLRKVSEAPAELQYRPRPREVGLTRAGDLVWAEQAGFEVLRVFRGRHITDLDAARTRSERPGRVAVRGDRIRWTPAGLPVRSGALPAQLQRAATCFPRGGGYVAAGDFGLVRVVGQAMYFCAPGPAQRTRVGGACAPRLSRGDVVMAWNDHMTWTCPRNRVQVVHVYAFSSRALLLTQRTNLVQNSDAVELTLSDFGAVAWVDRPSRTGDRTTMRVFAPGLGVQSFDEGGAFVADPSWTGRTITWLWFRTTSSPDVARSYTVPS